MTFTSTAKRFCNDSELIDNLRMSLYHFIQLRKQELEKQGGLWSNINV